MRRFDTVQGVIFDLPEVLARSTPVSTVAADESSQEIEMRLSRIPGSFLNQEQMEEELGGRCDMVLLKHILHDWGEQVKVSL